MVKVCSADEKKFYLFGAVRTVNLTEWLALYQVVDADSLGSPSRPVALVACLDDHLKMVLSSGCHEVKV